MANNFYNRNSSFNLDELADGDAIEAEFDAIGRGFDTIEDLVNANKAGYPTQTFHVAPAELDTHAVPKAQMDAALSFKLDTVNYNASDILTKLKTVDGASSGLDADYLDGQHGSYYRDASNINAGTLAKERLPGTIDSATTGNAATATKVSGGAPVNGDADLVTGTMGSNDFFRIRVGGTDNAGWVELATTDDGDEPIYVRQYGASVRTATLLDTDGNTRIPGKLVSYGMGFSFSDDEHHGLFFGGQDGAASTAANIKISSWYGIGFSPSISGTPVPQNEYSHWFDTRTGNMGCRGTISAWGGFDGNASTASNAAGNIFSTSGAGGENQFRVKCNGYEDAYMFNNSGAWGAYSARGGVAYQFESWNNRFWFNGHANTAGGVIGEAPQGGGWNAIDAKMAGDDFFRIRCFSGGYDDGHVEIATADSGNEPILVRQYNGQFGSVARTLTLLDGSGNTVIPGGVWSIPNNAFLNTVSVITGTVYHGNWLPIPDGYSEGQCRFFISMNNTNPRDNSWDLREGINTQHYSEYCRLINNRQVEAFTRVYNDINDSFQYHDGIVNYIVIGVK